MTRFMSNRCERIGSLFTALHEVQRLLLGCKTMVEFGLESHVLTVQRYPYELRCETIGNSRHEILDLALAFYDKADSHRLHTSCAQARDDLFPQDRRELEAYDTIHYAASLLRVDKVVVNIAGMVDRLQDGLLGGVVERDTAHLLLRQLEHLLDMPCDGLSLAVGVARQPDLVGLERLFAQRCNQLLFILIYHIIRRIAIGKVNAHAVSAYAFNISNMSLR